jgi:hypothetical protein
MSMEFRGSPDAVARELASALRDLRSARLVAAAQRYQSILDRGVVFDRDCGPDGGTQSLGF